tara:strand:+ start:7132 stop:7413 length:282 start_codon:yes stop_codon:yes gene_type:complete
MKLPVKGPMPTTVTSFGKSSSNGVELPTGIARNAPFCCGAMMRSISEKQHNRTCTIASQIPLFLKFWFTGKSQTEVYKMVIQNLGEADCEYCP